MQQYHSAGSDLAPLASGAARPAPSAAPPRPLAQPLERSQQSRQSSQTLFAEEWHRLDYRHGNVFLGERRVPGDEALLRLAPGLTAADLAGAAFIDVETTGLVGGTGTYVFLIGVATFENDSLRLRQLFLSDLGRERAMLAELASLLHGCRCLVTFNGKRFDVPLLETRFILSRLAPTLGRLPHVDLLYPARRLYRRRLPSCSLASLESAVLGFERGVETPGWAIPQLYFDYVRSGRVEPLAPVFRHNKLDLLSLVALLGHLGRLVGSEAPRCSEDCLAIAVWDDAEGRLEEAARLYEAAIIGARRNGLGEIQERLARLYRRLGRWEEAVRLWRELARDTNPVRRMDALIELAKFAEHRNRDYHAAEDFTREALAIAASPDMRGEPLAGIGPRQARLAHRLHRVQTARLRRARAWLY